MLVLAAVIIVEMVVTVAIVILRRVVDVVVVLVVVMVVMVGSCWLASFAATCGLPDALHIACQFWKTPVIKHLQ